MLTDMQSKQSFTTFNQETRTPCNCGNYDKFLLREKLQQILNCLYEEISSKQKQIQGMRKAQQSSNKQKEDIIQRLVSANSKLVVENQTLTKKLVKNQLYLKSVVADLQTKYQTVIKQMDDDIRYLEEKNMQLKKQIISTLSLIPQERITYQVRGLSPLYTLAQNGTRLSRHTYRSPPSRISTGYYQKDGSPPKFRYMLENANINSATCLSSMNRISTAPNSKKKSSRVQTENSQIYLQVTDVKYKGRSKSNMSRNECEYGGA